MRSLNRMGNIYIIFAEYKIQNAVEFGDGVRQTSANGEKKKKTLICFGRMVAMAAVCHVWLLDFVIVAKINNNGNFVCGGRGGGKLKSTNEMSSNSIRLSAIFNWNSFVLHLFMYRKARAHTHTQTNHQFFMMKKRKKVFFSLVILSFLFYVKLSTYEVRWSYFFALWLQFLQSSKKRRKLSTANILFLFLVYADVIIFK